MAILQLSEPRITRGFVRLEDIVKNSFGSVDALLQMGTNAQFAAVDDNQANISIWTLPLEPPASSVRGLNSIADPSAVSDSSSQP